jgi:dephospho-CoA kinase
VTAAGTEATAAIAARFGADILAGDGSVDRKKLGPIVFADPSARRELEAIVHPAVHRAVAAGIRGFERLGDTLAIVAVPLLYETGGEKDFDRVIVTACAPDRQVTRLRERGLTDADARRRLAAQWPTDKKTARADFVVTTDGSFADTDEQVAGVMEKLGM